MHSVGWKAKWVKPKPEHMKMTPWSWLAAHPENLKMDNFVDIGAFTYIQAEDGVTLHIESEIGSHCSIYSVNTIDGTRGRVVIEAGACIGSHCTIMPGVTIGCYSIVGAHSLVKTDIPPHEVWGGVPAKYMRNARR